MMVGLPFADLLGLADVALPVGALLPGMASALAIDEVEEGGAVTPATIEFLGSDVDDGNSSTYSFSSKALGAEASDRYIAAVFMHSSNNAGRTVNACSFAGVTATEALFVQHSGSSRTAYVAIHIAAVPTGTSGTLSITWDAALAHQIVFWYRITGIGALTPFHTASNSVDPSAMSLNVPAGGVAIGGAMTGESSAGGSRDTVWTNLTDDGNVSSDVGNTTAGSAAHGAFETSQTGLSISADYQQSSDGMIGACASWGPAT
jgi:hypothetical protein